MLSDLDDATPRTARAGRPAHGAGAAMLLARRPAEAGHRSAALQFAHECGGVGMDPPPPHAGTCQSAAPPPLRCALQGSWLQVRLWGVGCCSEGRVGAPRPRPRAVDRFLGSQYVKYVSAACSPPPPSSSPLLHGGDMRAPLVAASAGIAPPVSAVELVPPGVGVDAATWGKGPQESSGGVMGRGGGPRCLALQFCLPACLMSFPSYVP